MIVKGKRGQIINSIKPTIAVINIMIIDVIITIVLVKKPIILDTRLSKRALSFSAIDLPGLVVILFQGANKVFNKIGIEKTWIR